eukprot:CAMPEP_0181292816 /NCGR_PEP_ID=MMETSP1101-20121128/2722_1 /TAXON_ID=46948 /ORGANISM="Rhodomonas abbreviata, Strain Caron Lab Isolate" /LENGTH=75 /DNA_ID=CAMNT_0023397339 /DNA_START=1205 /DNA_END=1432 /DNA_ORIENTATION=+
MRLETGIHHIERMQHEGTTKATRQASNCILQVAKLPFCVWINGAVSPAEPLLGRINHCGRTLIAHLEFPQREVKD